MLRVGPDNVAQVRELTGGRGVERASIVRRMTRRAPRPSAPRASGARSFSWAKAARVEFNPSPDIIHDQKTIYGSWVTSTWLMEELVERLVRWNLHPADIVTHRFALGTQRSVCPDGVRQVRQSRCLLRRGVGREMNLSDEVG